MHFADRLVAKVKAKSSVVMVGLDPRLDRLPAAVAPSANTDVEQAGAYRRFCEGVIDAVSDHVPIVKPQAAFFEQLGPAGMQALHAVVQYARSRGLLVLLDAKRGDIGSTAEAYAGAYLGEESAWKADALTVNPYLGDDSLTPFVDACQAQQAGIFVLVKTSNPGGKRWQDLTSGDRRIYEHVGDYVQELAVASRGECNYGAVGAVVGATFPDELAQLRQRMPNTWFLVPGFGSQGGSAEDVASGFDAQGLGAIINSSRAIIFAHENPRYRSLADQDWQRAVEQATRDATEQLNEVRFVS